MEKYFTSNEYDVSRTRFYKNFIEVQNEINLDNIFFIYKKCNKGIQKIIVFNQSNE